MKILRRYYGRLALLAAVVIAVAAVLYPVNTYAANVNDSNKAHANAIEKAYVNAGNDAGIWISSAGKSYRDASVNVPYGNTSVGVQLRGSWYTRGYGYQEVTTSSIQSPNHAVTGIGGDFSRGTANSPWGSGVYVYNNSNYTTATLQVGNVCSGHAGQTRSVYVELRSTFRYKKSNTWIIGKSSVDKMNVTVNCAAQPWTISGTSTINKNSGTNSSGTITAAPGDTLNWRHKISNSGGKTTKSITTNIGMSDIHFSDWATGKNQTAIASGKSAGVIRDITSSVANYTKLVVTQDDVGNTLCQWAQYDPVNSSGTRNGRGNHACANVPYNYSLNPSVLLDKTTADVGTALDIDGKLTNAGVTKTRDTDWQFSYVTIPSDKPVPTPGNSSSTTSPCTFYKNQSSTISCDIANFSEGGGPTGRQIFNFSSSTYSFPSRGFVIPDLPVGTKLCYALSVKARSDSSSDWTHSALACLVISKHPVMQTLGGDVIVGRNGGTPISRITTSIKIVSGKRYGSWGEYGVIAAGSVSGMASASGYAGGGAATDICGASYLTLSNRVNPLSSCSASTLGSYTYGAAASTVADRFAITSSTPQISGDVTVGSLASGKTYTNNTSGSEIRLTMGSPATLPAGKWVVINAPNATVKIMGDLRYTTDALTKLSDIPQLVIAAKNIIVSDSATQVDAWLVATGTGTEGRINTCGAGGVTETSTITSKTCDKQLTVNGPVITNHLILRRTAGAEPGTASGDPAEIFNFRPDAYLWASSLQSSSPKAQTVQTVELPPRY